MRKLFVLVLLLIKNCLAGSDSIVLDLSIGADHKKFIKNRHSYRGIEYFTLLPMPGYTIFKIVYKDTVIYERKGNDDKIEGAYIYYNPYNNNVPMFIIKTAVMRENIHPIGLRSPIDEENNILVRTLMRFVRMVVPSHDPIHIKLRDLDERSDPVQNTVSTIAYRVFNGNQYLGGSDGRAFYGWRGATGTRSNSKEPEQMELDTPPQNPSTRELRGGSSQDDSDTPMDTS